MIGFAITLCQDLPGGAFAKGAFLPIVMGAWCLLPALKKEK